MFPPGGKTSRVMIRLDIAAIFLLIAATFTPIHSLLFSGWRRWGVLVPIWVIAISGITLRTIFFNSIPYWIGTLIFLAMGWIGLISSMMMWRCYRWDAVGPIALGGVTYSIGAVGDAYDWPILIPNVWGPHETFHFFVLTGLGFHWHLISKIVERKLLPVSMLDEPRLQR